MNLFKVYFKILNKNRKSILLPIIIGLGIAIMFQALNKNDAAGSDFSSTKTICSFINEGKETAFSNGLKDYLADYTDMKPAISEKDRNDQLFYGQVEYILILPAGYESKLEENEAPDLEKMVANDSFGSVNLDGRIDDYVNTWLAYKAAEPNLSDEELATKTKSALSNQANVDIMGINTQSTEKENFTLFFNHSEYALLGSLIGGIAIVLSILNKKEVKMRSQCSPLKQKTRNTQIVLASIVFSMGVYILNLGIAFYLFGARLFTTMGLWMCLNLLIFTVTTMSLGFFVATLSQSRQTQSAINNIVSLGMCFLSGSFVPQTLLSESVQNFSKFTPGYWFIKANDTLGSLSGYAISDMENIFKYLAIDFAFAVAILAVSLLLGKQKAVATSE